MVVVESKLLPTGSVALKKAGNIVWVGKLSDPWEDVDCDTAVVSPADYTQIKLRTLPAAASPQIVCCGCGGSPLVSLSPPVCAECMQAINDAR